mmetsp:Transcript_103053/g.291349  ORF Transcript_103053/g.291349 Transcript_103053/m.291349 type:complete len:571 (-) Transcript_103053:172-1884(-)|eukprot:CAMPEP_0168455292 /NCGR_PEP_ID=MMETSP0228-20121227/50674_1 /TAXON_ID=133427 /ORGANISM="Protoceratium reticulatum, Strain CCCM 535 (=CCMP 1889)" /LENGTH=570 /DNA_ID=CAMNT_0008470131 /DNA_START=36 /DNA_END=1748 /DNA_ORIENTATION=+
MADEEEVWDGEQNWNELEWQAWEEEAAPQALGPESFDINPEQFSKWPLHRFVAAAHDGDIERLAEMLNRDDPISGYHADMNAHAGEINALHAASVNGQLEVVEMLLRAKADPHVKASVPYGKDPSEGETAHDMADKWGWDDIVEVLKKAERETPKGIYRKYGTGNNAKLWPIDKPQGLDPEQERLAYQRYKGRRRPLPAKADRKFYGDAVYGVTHGLDEHGRIIRARLGRPRSGAPDEDAKSLKERVGDTGTPAPAPVTLASPVGLLFPGQGSQYVGMMEEVKDIPKVRELLATARQILGYDLVKLCREGPEARLEETQVCFPAVYVACLAGLEKLREQTPAAAESPGAVAGVECGEFAALTAAGVWDFDVGLTLVATCAEAVDQARKLTPQATVSIAGFDKATLDNECAEVSRKTGQLCMVSNELFPKGFTCAGAKEAVSELKKLVEAKGAVQARLLRTYGALHTPLMEAAREKLQQALAEALPRMRPPTCDVYLNSLGGALRRGTDPGEVVQALCNQLTSRVLWDPCVRSMIAAGATKFYEVGPSKQLKSMMKRIDATSWSTMSSVDV